MNGHWTRRAILHAGLATLGAATSASAAFAARGFHGNQPYPLKLPDTTPADLPLLSCAPAMVDLGDGRARGALAYNGQLPGPTWEARRGDRVTTRLYNGLGEPTTTHWHGLVVDFANDGGPMRAIGPGQSYDYDFPIIQRAGLNFYHPHPDMLTGKQVGLGLAGAFIVRDTEEDGLGLPAGAYEVPLVIRDVSFDSAGNLAYNPTSSGFRGKVPLVNGTLNATLAVDRGVYRLRVLNGANARVFRLALSNRAPLTLIGNDGGLLAHPATVSEVLLGMAERLDLLVDFSALGAGQTVTLQCLNARWNLVQFTGTGVPGVAYTAPANLSYVETLSGPSQPVRTFSFDGMSRINGQVYDMQRIDFQVPFGVTERWRFRTGGNAPHPIHVHGAHFQVVSRTGGRNRLFPWEAGWKDTVLLNDKETVDVLVRFVGYKGLYLIHCHQLEHEGAGMMANFEVI
jgi:FtsP/CotA-like multicopper oxidase with cupredoxin domain